MLNYKLLDEITKRDYKTIQEKITSFLVDEIAYRDSCGIVFGLSGGIDSAVIAAICREKLRKKTLALLMPDSKITPKSDTEDALRIIEEFGIEYKLLDINPIHSEYSKYIEPDKFALGNLRARIRSNILYYYANVKKHLVIGSSDKSELLIGYFTKFGDGAADLLPIASLYKTQVREFAKNLSVHDSIINKKSSPNLWQNHFAESEIGLSYEEIDSILYCIINKHFSIEETTKITNIEFALVEKIYNLYKKTEHKRLTPKICQI